MADSGLRGRRSECARLDGLLAGVRAGRSAALVIQGEAGVGKTALLEYVAGSAADLRVLRAAGVESEMELAFAALHQMCGPVLDRLGRLPDPQRAALGTAFGLQAGPPPDRFLIGLAVLSLLAEVAEDGPVVCVIDDARWLDRASARVLAFVARRLVAESVLMIFAVREPDADLDGLPELLVQGLREDDARQLLRSVVPWPLDERVAEQIVAETRGNPLALVRSAVYRSASGDERQAAHRALAEATDPQLDPDRRAWHRAAAAAEADEDLAAELERSAGRAQARGGLTAAAAFLERAAALTPDPARRAGRALAAAQAKAQAGLPDAALELLARAEAGPADELRQARIGLLRGQMAFASSHGADASRLLLHTARQLEPLDVRLARETYLDALAAAIFVGRLAGGTGLPEVARAALGAPPAPPPSRAGPAAGRTGRPDHRRV